MRSLANRALTCSQLASAAIGICWAVVDLWRIDRSG
jgi:hypothetical protein